MRPWWVRDPERLERELGALSDAGVTYEIDKTAKAAGQIRLQLRAKGVTGELHLTAIYPDFFPFFKPEVYTVDLRLNRHQNPVTGELCLLGRRTDAWSVTDTLADILQTQLPKLTSYAKDADLNALLEVEEALGEPFSDYYGALSAPGSVLLIDSRWQIPRDVREGTFTIQCCQRPQFGDPVRGVVQTVRSINGEVLARWHDPIPNDFSETVQGSWVQRPEAIFVPPEQFYGSLTQGEREYLTKSQPAHFKAYSRIEAILFPEEIEQQVFKTGWFALEQLIPKQSERNKVPTAIRFIRVARAGRSDLAARMPATWGLADKNVVVVGSGAIGAPTVLELARAGVGSLVVIDGDFVDPATVRRWVSGWPVFADLKVDALKKIIEREYPWTTITTLAIRIGAPAYDFDKEPRQGEVLEPFLEHADLILDATTEFGVNYFLSGLSRIRNIPYVLINATPGAWGGMVASFNMRADDACWICFRHALYGDNPIELPPADEAGLIQAPGCGELTFTGAGFDLQEVSLEAVRTVAGHLANEAGYPSTPWQAAKLALRAPNGARVPPHWSEIVVPKRPGCSCNQS